MNTRFSYHGTGGSILLLQLQNALLTILTLGIYSFWAKNNIRKFHYENTEVDGERFEYHGTGGELLRGALRAFGLIFLLSAAFGLITAIIGGVEASVEMQWVTVIPVYLVMGALMILAIHSTRRYRLSRSSWRTFRFSYDAQLLDFSIMMLKGILLTIVTIGLYSPFFANQRRAFFTRHVRFGSERFHYDGDDWELFGAFLRSLLLTIPTLGLHWFWYVAFKHRHFWNHTTFAGTEFQSTVNGTELLTLTVTNILLTIFTFGIGAPWAMVRMKAYYCDNTAIAGVVDWAAIHQRLQPATAMGEGLAEAFDLDVGIGM